MKYIILSAVVVSLFAGCRTVPMTGLWYMLVILASLGNLMSLKVKLINAWSLSGRKIAVYAALMKKFNMNIMW